MLQRHRPVSALLLSIILLHLLLVLILLKLVLILLHLLLVLLLLLCVCIGVGRALLRGGLRRSGRRRTECIGETLQERIEWTR